ncbi:hypothetical protein LSAT2_026207 [Lamellibrachia satsuma]|nr:hypothetical protein LSAT2_026207 [Lamellibrachia satsuma]
MKGRRSALMADAESSLIHYLTEDRSHLGEFLSQLTERGHSTENLVILVNTRLRETRPCAVYSDYTPLGYAIVHDDPQTVDLVLRHGAFVQSAPCRPRDNHVSVLSPLHLALKHQCQAAVVDSLLKYGASTRNILGQDAACLLEYVVKCPSQTTSAALLSDMSCLETTDNNRRTLLHLAAMNGKNAIVSIVLNSHLVDIDKFDAMGKTALIYAAEQNSSTIVQLLLDSGATVDLTDGWGRTALHFAVRRAGLKAVEQLLSAGADVGAQDRKGQTALKYAFSSESLLHSHSAKESAEDLINCLVRAATGPISLNRRDFVNVTFLLARTCENEAVIVKLLEDNISHLSQRDNSGQMLIHVAAEFNKHGVVKWLIEKGGVDATETDALGWQPLHCAAKGGNRDTLFCLLDQHGADVNNATPSGWTPVWIATRNGWTDLACDVIRYGADVHQAMTVGKLRQAESHFSLPLSLFDPESQRAEPITYARSGSRGITLLEFSTECGFAELSRFLV